VTNKGFRYSRLKREPGTLEGSVDNDLCRLQSSWALCVRSLTACLLRRFTWAGPTRGPFPHAGDPRTAFAVRKMLVPAAGL
jgi:hypothetical protein